MAKIKLRRDTAANWITADPVLAAGEPGLETDTNQIKYGDGTSTWTELEYSGGSGDSLTSETAIDVTVGGRGYWVAFQRRVDTDNNDDNGDGYELITPESLRYDSEGNLIVLVDVDHTDSDVKVLTKYSTTGTVIWQKSFDHGELLSEPKSVVIDSNDDIYVSGDVDPVDIDIPILIKFSGVDGSQLWAKTYDVSRSVNDVHVEVTSDDDLFMVWEEDRPEGAGGELMIAKVASDDGSIQWISTYGDELLDIDMFGMTVDADDNVIVSVRYETEYDEELDGPAVRKTAIIKVSDTGELVWQKYFEDFGGTEYNVRGGDMATDALGNIYGIINYAVPTVTVDGEGDQTAAIVYKITASGTLSWTRRIGPGPCDSVATAIDCDADGIVYVAATTFVRGNTQFSGNNEIDRLVAGSNHMIIASYTTSGSVRWQRYVDIPGLWEGWDTWNRGVGERGQHLSVRDGKIAVTGTATRAVFYSSDPQSDVSVFVAQLATDGRELEMGKDASRLTVRESRVPGRLVTSTLSTAAITYSSDSTVPLAGEDLDVTVSDSVVANESTTTEPYVYSFGTEGTLTIPNDGDIELTQSVRGWFSIFGEIQNESDHVEFRAVAHDSQGNLIAVGEDNDNSRPIAVKFDTQGQVIWSIQLIDDTDGHDGRANAVMIHPVTGSIIVTCEFYGDHTRSVLFDLEPDTGRITAHVVISDTDGDVAIRDTAVFSNGLTVVAGSKYGEFQDNTVDPQSGSGVSELVVLKSEIDDLTPIANDGWFVSGTGIVTPEEVIAVNNYVGATQSSTSGSGTGATFTVTGTDASYSNWNVTVTDGGADYQNGDTLIISGTDLGGSTPTNDMTITVVTSTTGVINTVSVSGTAQTTAVKLGIAGSIDFSSEASWTVSYPLDRECVIVAPTWQRTFGGGGINEGNDRLFAVATDASNNVYAVGVSRGGVVGDLEGYDLAVVYKFNSTGTLQWAKVLNEGTYDCQARSVAVQGSTVVVSHYSSDDGETVITKLNSSGTVLWQRVTGSDEDGSSVAIDPVGNIYALVEAYNSDERQADGWDSLKLIKFDTLGNVIWRRWIGTEYDDRLQIGRSLSTDGDWVYITGHTDATANDYDNGFACKIPADGSGVGQYGYFFVSENTWNWDDSEYIEYLVEDITAFDYITDQTPVIKTTDTVTVSDDGRTYIVDWYGKDNTLQTIKDQSGGQIRFADGTAQDTSAQDIPQINAQGQRYKLGMGDRGRHIYFSSSNGSCQVIVPYHESVPLPIGTTVTLINNCGNGVYIEAEGVPGVTLIYPPNGTGSFAYLDDQGIMTLIKVEQDVWFLTGGPGGWD